MPYDPTHTTSIRLRFVRQVNRRWGDVRKDIKTTIVANDFFGLQKIRVSAVLPPGNFPFETTPHKLERFMAWLVEQEEAGILEVVTLPGTITTSPWSNLYIRTAYQKGIQDAYSRLGHAGYSLPIPLEQAFLRPVHIERLNLLYSRTFEDLKTVSQVVNGRIRRELTDALSSILTRGIAEGQDPLVVAREIAGSLRGIIDGRDGIIRSRVIARSEIIRAHHKASIQEYREAQGDMEVIIRAEVSTAGDDRVCDICKNIAYHKNGKPRIYTLDEAENLIPIHAQCRCSVIPHLSEGRGAKVRARAKTPEFDYEEEAMAVAV